MTIKPSYYKNNKEDIKTLIIRDRLAHLFKENGKPMAKILIHLLKRHRNV